MENQSTSGRTRAFCATLPRTAFEGKLLYSDGLSTTRYIHQCARHILRCIVRKVDLLLRMTWICARRVGCGAAQRSRNPWPSGPHCSSPECAAAVARWYQSQLPPRVPCASRATATHCRILSVDVAFSVHFDCPACTVIRLVYGRRMQGGFSAAQHWCICDAGTKRSVRGPSVAQLPAARVRYRVRGNSEGGHAGQPIKTPPRRGLDDAL